MAQERPRMGLLLMKSKLLPLSLVPRNLWRTVITCDGTQIANSFYLLSYRQVVVLLTALTAKQVT